MANNGLDFPEIQERIEKQLAKEKRLLQFFFLMMSLILFLFLTVGGWSTFLASGGQLPSANIPGVAKVANPAGDALMLLTVAGFISWVMQLASFIMSTTRGERQLRERVTGRIMQVEMKKQMDAMQAAKSKPKRAMRLTDDGELEEVDDDIERSEARELHNRAR